MIMLVFWTIPSLMMLIIINFIIPEEEFEWFTQDLNNPLWDTTLVVIALNIFSIIPVLNIICCYHLIKGIFYAKK